MPADIIRLIAKYGDNYNFDFNTRKDIGPLMPEHIHPKVSIEDAVDEGIVSSYVKDHDNVLRASEQGPMSKNQDKYQRRREYKLRLNQLNREYKITRAIFGDRHPRLRMLNQKINELENPTPFFE